MKNLIKKSLAFVLVAALALTCFVGTYSAAEAKKATITIVDETITLGDEFVDVVLNISSPDAGINEALFKISSDIGTVTNVAVNEEANATIEYAQTTADLGNFFLSAKDVSAGETGTALGAINAATITVRFAVADTVEAGKSYPINIDIPADKVYAASPDEDIITLVYTNVGNVVVEEPHEHTFVYTPNDGDTHTFDCSTCENFDAVTEACTLENGACIYCLDPEEVVEPEHEHNWVFDGAIPATDSTTGSITFACTNAGCTEPDAKKTEVVTYYLYYAFPFTGANYASEISLRFSARDDFLDRQGKPEDVYAYFTHVLSSDGSTKYTVKSLDDAYPVEEGSQNRPCQAWDYGLKSMQLTESVVANLFVKVDGVWYNGKPAPYSFREYADIRLETCPDSEKKLIVDALTYGSKMQIFKKYNLENLADADLGKYASYVTEITDEVPSITATITNNRVSGQSGVYIYKYNLDMAERVQADIFFLSTAYTGDNKDDYKVVATWENANGLAKTINYTKIATGEENNKAYTSELDSNGNPRAQRFTFAFAELNSYDLRQPITFYIYDGENEVSRGYIASVEALVASGISNNSYGSAEIEVYKAMLNYSDSSRAHFCK